LVWAFDSRELRCETMTSTRRGFTFGMVGYKCKTSASGKISDLDLVPSNRSNGPEQAIVFPYSF
jgi:hypothetical protein